MASSKRILSTYANWADMEFWSNSVDSICLHQTREQSAASPRALLRGFLNALVLLRASGAYEALIVGPGSATALLGLFRRLLRRRTPRVIVLENLYERSTTKTQRWIKSFQFRLLLGNGVRAVVYARCERHRFSDYFSLAPEKFVFVPYHSTLHWQQDFLARTVQPEEFVFAGGDSVRDYRTLFLAVDGLDREVIVAIRDDRILEGLHVPPNVRITTTDHRGFLDLMQRASVNVVPLDPQSLRTAGHQTYLSAMALGSVVIVTDTDGASDYIENWKNGVLVPAGDAGALREALDRLFCSRELAEQIRRAARETAKEFTTERVLSHYVAFALSPEFDDPACTEFGTMRRPSTCPPKTGAV